MIQLRQIEIPSLKRRLANVMVQPVVAEEKDVWRGLDAYAAAGGDSLHLHGEGGETETRRAAGRWLREGERRSAMFLSAGICHDTWDEAACQPIDRFTPEAVAADVAANLELLGVKRLDLVTIDGHENRPYEGVIEGIAREMVAGRVEAYAIANWRGDRLRGALRWAATSRMPPPAAVVTTELALLVPQAPLWREYVPFDSSLTLCVWEAGLGVLAHAIQINRGDWVLDPAAAAPAGERWTARWRTAENEALATRVRDFAARHGRKASEAAIAWLLNQPQPTIAIANLAEFMNPKVAAFAEASQWRFRPDELRSPP